MYIVKPDMIQWVVIILLAKKKRNRNINRNIVIVPLVPTIRIFEFLFSQTPIFVCTFLLYQLHGIIDGFFDILHMCSCIIKF